jgi:hypothetical protein
VSGYTRSVNPSVLLAVADGDMLRVAATEEDLVFAEWVAFSNPYTGWSLTPPDTDGPRTLWMQVRDEALNPSETASVTVTLLREGPAMTEAKFSDSGYVTTATSTLSVTLDPGNVLPPVQVEYSCNAISYAVADWNAGSPALNVTSALAGCTAAQGARTVSVRLLDEIGNRGEIVAVPANLDNVAPAAPVITAPASCPVFVSTTPQTLTGTADPGSTITITGGFATATGTTTGGGTWSVPVGLKLNAPNNLTVTATDAAGNVGPGRTCTLRHDTVAPVFTDTTIELTATSVRVRWKTVGDNSTSVIEVRSREPIENYGTPVADSTLVEDHSIIFTGLSKNRKYEYRVSSTDQAGNTTVGPDVEFITYEAVPNVFYTGTRTMSETRTPYYSSGSFSIFPNTTLIISPGVTVAFGPNASIVIEGTLKAQGTALDPVTFTTNSPTPTPGAWDAIRFMHTCSDSTFTGQGVTKDWATGSILEHVVVEYGGGDADTGTSEHGAIEGMRCDVAIRDTVVRQSKHDGIYWYGGDQAGDTGTLVLRDSTLADNLGRGLFVETESSDSAMHAWVVSNRFSRNGDFGFSSHLADSLFIARNVFEANGGGAYVESAVTSLFDNVADSNTGSGYVFRSGIDGPATTAAYGNSAIRNTAANGAAFRDDNEDDKSQWITMGSFLVWGNTALDDDGASIALSKGRDESDAFLGTRWNSAGGSIFGNTGDWAVATKIEFPNSASAAYILDTYWNRALGTEISAFLVFDGADAPGTYGFVPFGDETDPKEFHVLPSMVAPLSPPISVAAAPAGAGAFTVSWTEGPEPDIAGHYVHYGATGDWPYDQTVDTGGVGSCSSVTVNSVALGDRCRTTCTISGVAAGVTHVAVTSYDALREVYVRVEPAAINAGSNQITATAHGFTDDWRVRVQAWDETGAVDARLPGGLDRCTDYYVNVVDANTLELSATVGGLPVDLTDQGVDLLQITAVEKAASLTRGAAAVAATDLDRTTGAMISTAGGFSGDVQGSFSLADCSAGFPLGVSPTDEYWLVPGYRTDAPAGQYTLSRVRGGPPVSLSGADSFAFSLAEVSAANDTITIAEHGLQTQTQVQFDVVDPLLDTLPAELAPPPAVFYVERVNVNAIKVRATRCGAAIDITDPGVGNFTMTVPADQVDGVGNLSFTPNAATSTVTRGAWRTDGHESWYSSDVTVTVP